MQWLGLGFGLGRVRVRARARVRGRVRVRVRVSCRIGPLRILSEGVAAPGVAALERNPLRSQGGAVEGLIRVGGRVRVGVGVGVR
eukprot:scaffold112088_cov50-Phaeocystis_antarctica.AAC.1